MSGWRSQWRFALFICDTGSLENSKELYGGISSGSALYAKLKTLFNDRNAYYYQNNSDGRPLKIQNGQVHTYCISIFWDSPSG